MRVTEIQRRLDGSRLELSATVTGLPGTSASQEAWIRLPAGAAPSDDPASDGAAWLAAMLPTSVALA
ncbi:MAG: hypothetical protein EXQ70_06115 [Solirubrobacterales bacterium]|nr:hypothetical protein [Solirubrobacterales bacterium]